MELAYLQTFCEVARKRSITRAAEELGYAQSSVTIQIQKLEKSTAHRRWSGMAGRCALRRLAKSCLRWRLRCWSYMTSLKKRWLVMRAVRLSLVRLIPYLRIFYHLTCRNSVSCSRNLPSTCIRSGVQYRKQSKGWRVRYWVAVRCQESRFRAPPRATARRAACLGRAE